MQTTLKIGDLVQFKPGSSAHRKYGSVICEVVAIDGLHYTVRADDVDVDYETQRDELEKVSGGN